MSISIFASPPPATVIDQIPVFVEHFSNREIEVLDLVGRGQSGRQIAVTLVISYKTVRTHIHNIKSKLGAHTRMEAVIMGDHLGLIDTSRARLTPIAQAIAALIRAHPAEYAEVLAAGLVVAR